MSKKRKHNAAHEIPHPDKNSPDIIPQNDPEDPVLPAEPDLIPEENPFETPSPYEIPLPGERP
jgi:hypothetical protein